MALSRLRILLVEEDEASYIMTLALLAGIEASTFELDWAPTYDAARVAIAGRGHDLYLINHRFDPPHRQQLLQQAAGGPGAPVVLLTDGLPSAADIALLKQSLRGGAPGIATVASYSPDRALRGHAA
jgi:hypothetical protein